MSSTGVSDLEATSPATPPSPPARLSIGQALNGTNNALGLIRLVLAASVIFDHAFPIGGWGDAPFRAMTRDQASLGSLAVAGFFAISGYLIAKSGMRGDVVQFMWRRSLRIFPAYWLLLLSTGLLVAPALWMFEARPLLEYLQATNWGLSFFQANWTLRINSYGILDLLATTTPYGELTGSGAFNGSIWTLIYEWNCYLLVAVLVAFGVLRNARILVPLITALFFVLQVVWLVDPAALSAIMPRLGDSYAISLGFAFLLGSTFAVYSDRVPFDNRLGVLAGLVLVLSLRVGGFATVGTIAGAYFVLYLAARLPRSTHWIGARNDYSYGVYIYGFLVQQVLAYFGVHRLGYETFVLISLVVTLGCAWISWHLVEKRALMLKDRGPGRGMRYWWGRLRSIRSRDTTEETA